MRLGHFAAFAPVCPACRAPLVLHERAEQAGEDVTSGTLLCGDAACRHEYPILDGIPVIVRDLPQYLSDHAAEMLLRSDTPPATLGLIGDALGPGSWLDTVRQMLSTYGWDAYADQDAPDAAAAAARPGAAQRCLAALLAMADAPGPALDAGCGAGRTTFALAARPGAGPALGIDLNFALLRLARRAARDGRVAYDLRRIGTVYDRRDFAVTLPGAGQVDFWAADAADLPLPPGRASVTVALNLLDCVPDGPALLRSLAAVTAPGGALLLATPFDWTTRATPMQGWIGGHSQRGPGEGRAEPLLRALLTEGALPQSIPGLDIAGTAEAAWHTRLHARATVSYASHLIAARRRARMDVPLPA